MWEPSLCSPFHTSLSWLRLPVGGCVTRGKALPLSEPVFSSMKWKDTLQLCCYGHLMYARPWAGHTVGSYYICIWAQHLGTAQAQMILIITQSLLDAEGHQGEGSRGGAGCKELL